MIKADFLTHLWQSIKLKLTSAPQSQTEVQALLKACHENALINYDTLNLLEGVLALAPMRVRDIVVPKSQMIIVSEKASLHQAILTVTESGHSRFPVTDEANEEIIGILHAKDLLHYEHKSADDFELYDRLRPAVFVPESKPLLTLLSEFRKNRNHMAIVVDEYGAVNGLVTIEDIIEQIIGEIEDEFDIDDEHFVKDHGKNRYTLKGHTPIEDFNETFSTQFSDEDYDTISGILTSTLGHLPKRGEIIDINGLQFKILHADARRIQLIECIDKRGKDASNEETQDSHN